MEMRYPDLRATVHTEHVPAGLADELPGLYSSLCSTLEWFRCQDRVEPRGACVLEDPRDVLLFTVDAGTVTVLNKATRIRPDAVRRACLALFRAFPQVHRVHIEVMFSPRALHAPHRVLYWADHQMIGLPGTVEAYDAGLGPSTRKSLRKYQNRLMRDFPDLRSAILAPRGDCDAVVDLLARWKTERFQSLGRPTFWQTHPHLRERFAELLCSRGEVHMTTIDGRPAALQLVYPVGDAFYVDQSAFDPAYAHYRLGLVSGYWVARNAIERGGRYVGQMWGSEDFKERLGAHPVRATRLSVFRSQLHRLHSLDEAREVALRNVRRNGQHLYWRARSAVGRRGKALWRRYRGAGQQTTAGRTAVSGAPP